MKNSHAAALIVAAVAATAGFQEWRLGGQEPPEGPESAPGVAADKRSSSNEPDPTRSARVSERSPKPESRQEEEENEGFSKTVRKMWDNPAGKSMMNQGVKVMVAMMYEDYINRLDLSDEETAHFKQLLGQEMVAQQELGMKMMSADADQKKQLLEDYSTLEKESQDAIKTFLNNDEDWDDYRAYKDRLPERQQLDTVRNAMAAKGAPMEQEIEDKLIEAMHKARTQPGVTDLNGAAGLAAIDQGNALEVFESNWEQQQQTLKAEAGFLSDAQQEAFFEYQQQMKEFQIMSLKMAEKMMQPDER